jgi:hypothetical protein
MSTPESNPSGRRSRRMAVGLTALAGLAAGVVLAGLTLVVLGHDDADANPLDDTAPGLSHFSFHPRGCAYQPDRGGMVAHFEVTTSDRGRFTLDVQAVTREGADDLDIVSPHVVRYTVPFYGGRATRQFDVVVPLTDAEHQDGYRRCRYVVNGSQ